MTQTVSADRRWFGRNPNANMRLRLPGDDEVERILRRVLPSTADEIGVHGGKAPSPSDDTKWVVAVIKVDADTMLKILVLRPKDWKEDQIEIGFSAYTIFFGQTAFIERVKG